MPMLYIQERRTVHYTSGSNYNFPSERLTLHRYVIYPLMRDKA